MAEEAVGQAVGLAAFAIAFITALFYIYVFGYLAGYNRELNLPVAFRDISFLTILSTGNGLAQLATIFLLITFPLGLIYKYPSKWIYLAAFIFLLMIIILKFIKYEHINWIDNYLLYSIYFFGYFYLVMFLLSLVMPSDHKNALRDTISDKVTQLTPYHYAYILIIITFLLIILSPYLGAKQAKRNMEKVKKFGDYKIEIFMKNGECFSGSNGPYFLLAYTNGNYIICNDKLGQDKQKIFLIPNTEVQKAILYRPNAPSTNDNQIL